MAKGCESSRPEKEYLYNKFKLIFKEQLNLDLTEILTITGGELKLSMELLAISMASLKLDLTESEHKEMSKFLMYIEWSTF